MWLQYHVAYRNLCSLSFQRAYFSLEIRSNKNLRNLFNMRVGLQVENIITAGLLTSEIFSKISLIFVTSKSFRLNLLFC